jgi:magnesium chelatase accessory protein
LGADETRYYRRLFSDERHVQAALDMMAHWDLRSLERCLPTLEVPFHLIACSEDIAVPAEQAMRLREMMARAEVHYVRGQGHLAHEEAPLRIGELVRRLCCAILEQNGAIKREAAP